MPWNCKLCKSEVDDEFDICWSCGASFDGEQNPHFSREMEATDLPADGTRNIRCEKCGFTGHSIQSKPVDSVLSGLFFGVFGVGWASNLTNHACPDCGETRQIYDWQPK